MIATLKQSKAGLSALVERAASGDEVIITVRGRPKARLCPIGQASRGASDGQAWAQELQLIRNRWTRRVSGTSAEILDALREDRV